jgi:hypothetical protein
MLGKEKQGENRKTNLKNERFEGVLSANFSPMWANDMGRTSPTILLP